MARHRVWAADLEFRRHMTPAAAAAWTRAVEALQRVEVTRP
jgi:hypothetical protein